MKLKIPKELSSLADFMLLSLKLCEMSSESDCYMASVYLANSRISYRLIT